MLVTTATIKTHIYSQLATAISRADATILQSAIDAAMKEAMGYCSRYDVNALFLNSPAVVGYTPDPILAMHVKSMARWHFITLANPGIDYEDAQIRYEQAIKWLLNVQSGKVVPPGWPPVTLPTEDHANLFHYKSLPKRNNHF